MPWFLVSSNELLKPAIVPFQPKQIDDSWVLSIAKKTKPKKYTIPSLPSLPPEVRCFSGMFLGFKFQTYLQHVWCLEA